MDAGDLIYVGIIGIALISGIVKQVKKSKLPESESTPPPPVTKTWDEILGDLRMPLEEPKKEEPVTTDKKKPEFHFESQEKLVDELSDDQETTKSSTPIIKEPISSKEEIILNEKEEEAVFNPEEMKKAIIYSEIINKRYN